MAKQTKTCEECGGDCVRGVTEGLVAWHHRKFCGTACSGTARGRNRSAAGSPVRFWSKVAKEGKEGCRVWTGSLLKDGYGQVRVNRKTWLTHRLAWTLVHGKIPDGLFVLHKCDNPPCCNPDHLFLGTSMDNMADMVAKGRSLAGENHPRVKLSDDDVREIRRRATEGEVQRVIAADYGIVPSHVSHIVHRRYRASVV